ncbi:MAG: hydantoinase/oxoprolinase N-terminal domain-containing protein [Mycoplasmatales bacterium]
MYKIAIDVGGTNTDAVLCKDDGLVIKKVKINTTKDIQSGIEQAIQEIIKDLPININEIKYAMLGTTQCTNAIIERKKLEKVSVIRLATGCTQAIVPFFDWPEDLKKVTKEASIITDGGYEYDGQILGEINLAEIENFIKQSKTKNFAISCVYSPLKTEQEKKVLEFIKEKIPDANVSISSEIGSLSLLERENATILNSALKNVIKQVSSGFEQGLQKVGIKNIPLYICQNDGTIMSLDYALNHPILTISSGPTNSIRGGAKLVNKKDAIIVDIGGTTTDIGALVNSLARESQGTTNIGGVDSNFRMPDMISLGLGGGTIVCLNDEDFTIGPDSVGHNLVKEALCFGGSTLTLTDVAKRLGRTEIGSSDITSSLSLELAQKIDAEVNQKILNSIDIMKTNNQAIDVILVGGGSIILNPDIFTYDTLNIPNNHNVANAIGASIVQVSGSHEGVFSMKNKNPETQVNKALELAKLNALKSGAIKETLEVVDIEKIPLSYHPEEAYVIKTKVIGKLN